MKIIVSCSPTPHPSPLRVLCASSHQAPPPSMTSIWSVVLLVFLDYWLLLHAWVSGTFKYIWTKGHGTIYVTITVVKIKSAIINIGTIHVLITSNATFVNRSSILPYAFCLVCSTADGMMVIGEVGGRESASYLCIRDVNGNRLID